MERAVGAQVPSLERGLAVTRFYTSPPPDVCSWGEEHVLLKRPTSDLTRSAEVAASTIPASRLVHGGRVGMSALCRRRRHHAQRRARRRTASGTLRFPYLQKNLSDANEVGTKIQARFKSETVAHRLTTAHSDSRGPMGPLFETNAGAGYQRRRSHPPSCDHRPRISMHGRSQSQMEMGSLRHRRRGRWARRAEMENPVMRNPIDIDHSHSRAIIREIGERLRTALKVDREHRPASDWESTASAS